MSAITFLVAVGIDIAKAHFDAARLGADGKYKHRKFANTPEGFALFAEWLAGFETGCAEVGEHHLWPDRLRGMILEAVFSSAWFLSD